MNKLLLPAAIAAAFTLGCLFGQERCQEANPADYYRSLYWEALGHEAGAKENPEKWIPPKD